MVNYTINDNYEMKKLESDTARPCKHW